MQTHSRVVGSDAEDECFCRLPPDEGGERCVLGEVECELEVGLVDEEGGLELRRLALGVGADELRGGRDTTEVDAVELVACDPCGGENELLGGVLLHGVEEMRNRGATRRHTTRTDAMEEVLPKRAIESDEKAGTLVTRVGLARGLC